MRFHETRRSIESKITVLPSRGDLQRAGPQCERVVVLAICPVAPSEGPPDPTLSAFVVQALGNAFGFTQVLEHRTDLIQLEQHSP